MSLLNVSIYYGICYYFHGITEILLWTPLFPQSWGLC